MKFRVALFMIALAVLVRILPHPYNFTPLGAMGLFSAAYVGQRWLAWVLPFAALFLSDLFLNNVVYAEYYSTFVWLPSLWTYAGFAAVVGLGMIFLRGRVQPFRVPSVALLSTLAFFLVTNFGSWIELSMYPKTFNGLMTAYAAGLPFLGANIAGDLCFSIIFFGAYECFNAYTAQLAYKKA
jgi:hypothetical protein